MTTDEDLRRRTEVCIVACAEVFRGAGEVLASAFGSIPRAGAGLARLTFSPDLLQTDGEARLVAEPVPLGDGAVRSVVIEGWLPFRKSFDLVWSGRRHALMGAVQIDRFGNSNLSVIGDWNRPKVQLIGVRGLPGNTVNHPCSYWVPAHSPRVFVEHVDMVSGVGYEPGRLDGGRSDRFQNIHRIVTNLGVLDFAGSDRAMRLRSLHPGVTVEEVRAQTGFELEIPERVETTRSPTEEEQRLIREVLDPQGRTLEEVRRG